MPIEIFNTMTKKKEVFKPIGSEVKMFVCGPTVYDYSHLGHARTYSAYDIISKWLLYRGFRLLYLMNITDVDDKIINRANEMKKDARDVALEFEKAFFEDMKALGIDTVNIFPRASEHIKEIINQIERLIARGYAYVTETGIYFDITKFKEYGELSHQKPEELKKHRIEPDPTKKNPQDFALWKFYTTGPLWDSPWKKGRPGWHIEDTAIAERYLGQQYDVHGGAIELAFPHHEAEIAQMESVSGKKPMVKYWTHTGLLLIKGEKMAKSLGNFVTIRDALKKYEPEVLRLFFAFTQYRSPIDFQEKNLKQAEESLKNLYTTLENLLAVKVHVETTDEERKLSKNVEMLKQDFSEAMDDDFNTPVALDALFKISTMINKFLEKNNSMNDKVKIEIVSTLRTLGGVLGILRKDVRREEEMPEEVRKLVIKREIARKQGNFKAADEIRQKILREHRILIEDTKEGIKWKKV